MHILYFHQHFSTPSGSAGTRSYEMAVRLVEAGHCVTIVCGSYRQGTTGLTGPFSGKMRTGTVEGIDIVEFDLSYGNDDGFVRRTMTFLNFARRSIGIALTRKADLVFATTTPLTAALPGLAAKWFRRRAFVFEVRDLWPELPRAMGVIRNPVILGAMGLLEWLAYRSADRLIGLSPGIVDGIARLGVPRDRIALIPNGCDLELFADGEPWRPDGVAPGDLLAVFTGTHGVANGLDALLDAAVQLKRRQVSGIKLLLVGDGKCKAALVARAEREGLGDYVLFHPPVPKRRLAGLMAAADIGLQILADVPAFYYGTSPNKFFDYLSAGLPVMTNYPGWIADLVQANGAGLAVPPRDPAAFADALMRVRDGYLPRMAGQARALAERAFDRNMLGRQFVDWLEESAR